MTLKNRFADVPDVNGKAFTDFINSAVVKPVSKDERERTSRFPLKIPAVFYNRLMEIKAKTGIGINSLILEMIIPAIPEIQAKYEGVNNE